MDAAETSNQHIETTKLYITIGDADIAVYLCIIIDELFRAISAETSNVNIKTGEPDVAIKETVETVYVIFDDVVFGRLGRRCGDRGGHHIERGFETSYLTDGGPETSKHPTPVDVWLKC